MDLKHSYSRDYFTHTHTHTHKLEKYVSANECSFANLKIDKTK